MHIPDLLARLSASEIISLCLLAALVGLIASLGVTAWKRSRITAEEIERLRRAVLNARGQLGDATLVEVRENLIFYSYEVRGVEYTASQDVSALRALLPSAPTDVNGVVYIKYDPRNPANSMILCEEWSGLRNLGGMEGAAGAPSPAGDELPPG